MSGTANMAVNRPLPATLQGAPSTHGMEPRWSLAFLGVLVYLIIEYTRLAAVYTFLLQFHVAKIAAAIALVGLVFAKQELSGVRSQSRSVDFGVLAFVLVSLVSTVLARDMEMAWEGFADILRWATIYFLVSRIVTSRWRMHVFFGLLMLLNLKLAQFQIRSYLSQKAWGRSEAFLAKGVGVGSTGFFANSNDFALAMCVAWPLAGILILGEDKKWLRLFMLTSFITFSSALMLSGSRGGLLGALSVALVACIIYRRRTLGFLMVLVLTLGVLYVLPDANKDRVRSAASGSDPNVLTRLNLWKMGLRMYLDNPIWGVGPNNFRPESVHYQPEGAANRRPLTPHSIHIQALSEVGALGTLALIWIVAKALRLNLRTCRRVWQEGKVKQSLEWFFASGLNLALVGYLVSGSFLTVLYYPHLWFLLALTVGLNTATATAAARKESAPAVVPQAPWQLGRVPV
ncbi:MAG: O-antigen ligase family protein [Terriglobales bacterium]